MNESIMRNRFGVRQPWVVAAWLVLALLSQYSAQRLIIAGPFVRHQHYFGPAELLTPSRLAFVSILILQAILVGIGAGRLWPRIREAVRAAVPGWRIVVVAFFFVMSAAALSRSPKHVIFELGLGSLLQLVALANVAVAVAAIPKSVIDWLTRQADRVWPVGRHEGNEMSGIDRFDLAVALVVVLVAALLSLFSYQRHPHVPDEVPYIFHARYFAAGKLFLPAPPVPAAFDVDLVSLTENRWFSPVPPGWPAVLAVGARLGIPWIVNPVLAGLNVLLAGVLLRQLYPLRTAKIAVLLLAVSPWFLFMGMNFMTHMSSLAAALAAAAACGRFIRSGNFLWAVPAGAFTGALSLIRPLEGLILAMLLSLWLFSARTRSWGSRLAALFILGGGSILVGSIVLAYNAALAGDPFRFPLNAYIDANYPPGSNDMGFGANRGLGWSGLDPFPGHGIRDVVVNAIINLHSISIELSGWATGSMIVLAAVALSTRLSASDKRMLVTIAAVAGLHSFYWFSGGPDFGARYWFLAIVPLVALVARAPEILAAGDGRSGSGSSAGGEWQTRVTAGMVMLSLLALVTFVPWRAVDKYRGYRGMIPGIRAMTGNPDFANALVLIRGKRHPDYASAAVYNPLDFAGGAPVFAWARTPEVERELRASFPGRRVVVVDGPSITGDGYRLAQPLSSPSPGTSR